MTTRSIEVKPGMATPLFASYEVAPGTSSGIYKGEVRIGANKVPVSLKVWNFELPPGRRARAAWRERIALS